MQNYKELKVWQKAHEFVLHVYVISQSFPKTEIFALTNQLRRAAVSIAANIAEGCGKRSQKDLAHFLNISLGSSNECEYYLILAKDLDYIDEKRYSELTNTVNRIKAMLINLLLKVRTEK